MRWEETTLAEAQWVCVDVETTGLDVQQGHRVCEVAAVKGGLDGEVEELDTLVNPDRPLPPEASAVSGLTDAHVAGAPGFLLIAPALLDLLSGAVLVAHNAPFDVGFLETELDRAGLSLPAAPVVDTTVVAQVVLGLPVRNLAGVAKALRLPEQPTHRALDDARATRGVLLHGLRRLAEEGARTVGEVMEALLPSVPADRPLFAAALPVVCEALRNGLDLRLTYEGNTGLTERVVRPIRLEPKGHRLILAAYCRTRRAPRNFTVSRIVSAELAVE